MCACLKMQGMFVYLRSQRLGAILKKFTMYQGSFDQTLLRDVPGTQSYINSFCISNVLVIRCDLTKIRDRVLIEQKKGIIIL